MNGDGIGGRRSARGLAVLLALLVTIPAFYLELVASAPWPLAAGLYLIAAGVMEVSEAGTITFPRDHLFRSPSSAASALLGRTANGWREWKNAQGLTLSQVKR